jgi:hypothetical protein
VLVGDIADGRAIIVIRASASGERYAVVVDLKAKTVLSPLIGVPPRGLLQLSEDGARIVYAQTEVGQAGGGKPAAAMVWTGHFRPYEVQTGAAGPETVATEVAGDAQATKLLCSSPDGRVLFFVTRREQRWTLGAVTLGDGGAFIPVKSDFAVDGSTECVIADR